MTVAQYQPNVSKIPGPFSATILAMMQPMANGATAISQWVTCMMTAFKPWKNAMTLPAAGTRATVTVQAMPSSRAKKIIPSELGGVADTDANGLVSSGLTMSSLKMSPAVRPLAPASLWNLAASCPWLPDSPSCTEIQARKSGRACPSASRAF